SFTPPNTIVVPHEAQVAIFPPDRSRNRSKRRDPSSASLEGTEHADLAQGLVAVVAREPPEEAVAPRIDPRQLDDAALAIGEDEEPHAAHPRERAVGRVLVAPCGVGAVLEEEVDGDRQTRAQAIRGVKRARRCTRPGTDHTAEDLDGVLGEAPVLEARSDAEADLGDVVREQIAPVSRGVHPPIDEVDGTHLRRVVLVTLGPEDVLADGEHDGARREPRYALLRRFALGRF